jgi:hypothetical protein
MLHICDICCVGIICFGIILDCIVIFASCNFLKSLFYCRYNAKKFLELTRVIFWRIFFCIPCWLFLHNHVCW